MMTFQHRMAAKPLLRRCRETGNNYHSPYSFSMNTLLFIHSIKTIVLSFSQCCCIIDAIRQCAFLAFEYTASVSGISKSVAFINRTHEARENARIHFQRSQVGAGGIRGTRVRSNRDKMRAMREEMDHVHRLSCSSP